MGLVGAMAAFLALRFLGGVASAFVLVLGFLLLLFALQAPLLAAAGVLTNLLATNSVVNFTDRTATNYRARFCRVAPPLARAARPPDAANDRVRFCHPRESGDPDLAARTGALDSRLRGNDTTLKTDLSACQPAGSRSRPARRS